MSVKQAAEAVGIWTEDNWDVKRVNSSYTMVSGIFNFKRNKKFYLFSWSLVVRDFYTIMGLYYWRIKQVTRAGLASTK